MNCKDFLMRLSGAVGVSGRESSVVALAAEELRALGEVSISPLGDLICTIRRPEGRPEKFYAGRPCGRNRHDCHLD